MRSSGLGSPRGLLTALVLCLAGLALAWLCFRTALVRVLTPFSPPAAQFAPHDPNVVLSKAMLALVQPGGKTSPALLGSTPLSPALVDEVRQAAVAAPLDARPYLILGHQRLAQGRPRQAIALLEAGQRLDPRQRLIHILLLQEYFKSAQYDKAAGQLSVLSRLVGAAQQPIAKAVALMTTDPNMREPVRRTLRTDPDLEQNVLAMLATGDAMPADLFDLASPTGIAHAGDKGGWGSILVARLVNNGEYATAHNVWQRIYRIPDAAAGAPIFNPAFRKLPASPPFNWTLAAGSLGAADPRDGSLLIDYYGRDSGDLASQLLLLRPGRYRFSFVVEGGKADAASRLSWLLTCAGGSKAVLMNAGVVPAARARRVTTDVAVPAGCPAQTLALHGEAGEFPTPVNTTLSGLALGPAPGARL